MKKIYLGNQLLRKNLIGNNVVNNIKIKREFSDESINFFNATGIINVNLQNEIEELVFSLKENDVWHDIEIIYPFVCDNTASLSTQFSYNLKNTGSYLLSFPNGVSGSDFAGFNTNEAMEIFGDTTFAATGSIIYGGIYTNSVNTDNRSGSGDFGGTAIGFGPIQRWFSTGRSLDNGNTIKTFYAGGSGTFSQPVVFILDSPPTPNTGGFFQYKLNPVPSGSTTGSLAVINVNGGNEEYSNVFPQVVTNTRGDIKSTIGGLRNARALLTGSTDFTNKKYQMVMVGYDVPNDKLNDIYTIVQNFQTSVDTIFNTDRVF